MKIGFITTLQTNIGDDFVREGIRAVLDGICSYQPYLINKHQPEATCTGYVPEDAPEPVEDKILAADAVIQCGAPVYWNLGPLPGQKCSNAEWIEPLWYDRIAKIYKRTPLLNIAAGACQGYFGAAGEITGDPECQTLIRDIHHFCRLLTVRDRMAYDVNASLALPVHLAPCTSIFAWRRCWPDRESRREAKTRPIALNFMRLGGHYDIEGRVQASEWRKWFREIARLLREAREQILPVAHNPEEKDLLEQLLPGHPVFYSSDYLDYFPIYAQCRGGIFNRIHGALLLAGRGIPSVVIGNDSRTRMADELGLPRWHVSEAEPKVIVDRLLDMVHDENTRSRLLEMESHAFRTLSDRVRCALPVEPATGTNASVAMPPVKQSVLVVHSGGLGDLVLASQAVGSIKRAHPEWHVTLACRAGLASVASLYPVPPDEVLPIELDSYQWSAPSPELLEELRPVVEGLKSRQVDICVLASLQPTWFEWLLASVFRPSRALCCTHTQEQIGFLSFLRDSLGLKPRTLQRLNVPERAHEQRRYQILLEALDIPSQSSFPWSREERLRADDYLVCFPSGSPGTKVKRWPLENFAEALCRFQAQWRLPVVLLGDAAERNELQDLADRIGGAEILAGAPIADAARLLAHARLYVGNDTGPMHLAAAYGVPGVAIFGGGHWPSYAPWAPGSIGMVSPMPCFGCDWDCVFDRGVCVESVPVDQVSKALDDVMSGSLGQAESRVWNDVDPKLQQIAQSAASKYRLLQSDRAERLHQLTAIIQNRDGRIAELEKAVSERLDALLATDVALQQISTEASLREKGLHELTAIIELRDGRIAELEKMASERLDALLAGEAALQKISTEADLREKGLHELTAIIEVRDGRIAELEKVASERLDSLLAADSALRQISTEADLREKGLHELTAIIANRDRSVAELKKAVSERQDALLTTGATLREAQVEARLREQALHEATVALQAAERRVEVLQESLAAISWKSTRYSRAWSRFRKALRVVIKAGD